jgi:hypothetical protein
VPNFSPPLVQVDFALGVHQALTYPPRGVGNQLTGLQLPDVMRATYKKNFFVDNIFFGAFAVTKDFGYGFAVGANSIETAHEITTVKCIEHGAICLGPRVFDGSFRRCPDRLW